MYTANTMASRPPRRWACRCPAAPRRRPRTPAGTPTRCAAARPSVALVDAGITARDILTKKAFENAITVVMALGGSTNAVLHLLAIAHEAGVDLGLDDFNRIGDRTPHLADVKPFGRYVMTDIDRIGGIPVVMKALLDAGLLHGDALTVTGKTLAENLAELNPPALDGDVLHTLANPIHRTGGIAVLQGSLAPEGAVVKSAGFDAEVWEGPARVFDGEKGAMDAVAEGTLQARRRHRHPLGRPEGRPGHAGDAGRDRRDQGRRSGQGRAAADRRPVLRRHHRVCASGTSRRRPRTAVRSRWCRTAT